MRLLECAGLSVCLLAAIAVPSHATPITGVLDISGSVAVGATTIDWLPLGTGTGVFKVEPASSGFWSALAGTTGTAKDLDVTVQPVGSTFLLPGYLTFAAMPNLSFDLTFIQPGVFPPTDCGAPPAAGQNCTPLFPPPKSPFNLTNTAVGSTASFAVNGNLMQSGSLAGTFTGVYTTQFVGQNYQSLLATIQNGGAVQASYSANFSVSEIPEPSTVSLAITGILLLAGVSGGRKLLGNRK